jgi:hypothetical protein
MSGDRVRSQAKRGQRRAAAVGIALCAHVAFLAALLWQAGVAPPPSIRPLDVQLLRVPIAARRDETKNRQMASSLPSPAAKGAPATPGALPIPASPIPTASEAPSTPPPSLPNIASALRAGLGCDAAGLAGLTTDERRRCQDRFVAREETPGRTFAALGPSQQAHFDAAAKRALWWQEPFLAKDPHNGCRPKVTNQQAGIPGGHASMSDWRVSMGCAVSF